jgi:hypothetical protein
MLDFVIDLLIPGLVMACCVGLMGYGVWVVYQQYGIVEALCLALVQACCIGFQLWIKGRLRL